MLPQCCDPDQAVKALMKWGVYRPNVVTLKQGWTEHQVRRPSLVVPIDVPNGYLMAYPEKRAVTPASDLSGFDAFIFPGGAAVFLPGFANWHIYYSGSTAIEAVVLDASHPVAAQMLNCGDGAYAVPTHTAAAVDNVGVAALPANARAVYRLFVNDSVNVMYLMLGAAAAANQGIRLNANGGSYEMSKKTGNLYKGAVNAIAAVAGPSTLLVTEGGIPVPT